jgi:hypothetical protein
MKNVSCKVAGEIKTRILCSISLSFSENCAFYKILGKIWQNQTGHRRQYNAAQKMCDFHAG